MGKYWILSGLLLAVAATLYSCKTAAPKEEVVETGDEQALLNAAEQWKQALESKNLDQVMAVYSEQFRHPDVGDKAGMRSYLDEASSAGALDGLTVDTSAVKVALSGTRASVAPIRVTNAFSQLLYELTYVREAEGWRVIASSTSTP